MNPLSLICMVAILMLNIYAELQGFDDPAGNWLLGFLLGATSWPVVHDHIRRLR